MDVCVTRFWGDLLAQTDGFMGLALNLSSVPDKLSAPGLQSWGGGGESPATC